MCEINAGRKLPPPPHQTRQDPGTLNNLIKLSNKNTAKQNKLRGIFPILHLLNTIQTSQNPSLSRFDQITYVHSDKIWICKHSRVFLLEVRNKNRLIVLQCKYRCSINGCVLFILMRAMWWTGNWSRMYPAVSLMTATTCKTEQEMGKE